MVFLTLFSLFVLNPDIFAKSLGSHGLLVVEALAQVRLLPLLIGPSDTLTKSMPSLAKACGLEAPHGGRKWESSLEKNVC